MKKIKYWVYGRKKQGKKIVQGWIEEREGESVPNPSNVPLAVRKESGYDEKGKPCDVFVVTELTTGMALYKDQLKRWAIEQSLRLIETDQFKQGLEKFHKEHGYAPGYGEVLSDG